MTLAPVQTEPLAVLAPAPRQDWRILPRKNVLQRVWHDRVLLLMFLPCLLYLMVFQIVPDLGDIIAFENYLPFIGFIHSQWVGLENFRYLLVDNSLMQAAKNTGELWLLQTLFYFPAPIFLALLLNGLVDNKLRRAIQSVVTLPHFLAWTVIVTLYNQVFGRLGTLNHLLGLTNSLHPLDIVTNPSIFKLMMTAQLIWKETGWGTIIYLAALLMIDVQLYEAAAVDGAGWWRRLWHVTMPGLIFIISLFLILQIGQITTTGGEQVLLQRDAVGSRAADTLYTYTYFHGIFGGAWSISTAAGLMNGLFSLLIIIGSYRLARRYGFNVSPGKADA
ncbi:MAG: sugar ABC transporter permease [Chloroflexi bacterium]|nr:sugar ABC transporter permease [Chloroflexota bacterium]